MADNRNKPPSASATKLPQNAKRQPIQQSTGSSSSFSSPIDIQQQQQQQRQEQQQLRGTSLNTHSIMHNRNSAYSFNDRTSIPGISRSLARATELLMSQSSDHPAASAAAAAVHSRSLSPQSNSLRKFYSNNNDGEESDSTTATTHSSLKQQQQQRQALEPSEVAKRLKRHLVTRPLSTDNSAAVAVKRDFNDPNSKNQRHDGLSKSLNIHQQQQHRYSAMMAMATADDAGYNGDDNEDYDPSSLLMAGDHRGDQQRQPQPKQRHEVVDPLTLPSGDITHHIYRWQGKNDQSANDNASNSGNYLTFAANTLSLQQQQQQQQQQPANFNSPSIASNNYRDSPAMSIGGGGRRRSFSGWDSDSEWDIGYTRRQINAPGGFRRQFVRERAVRQGRQYPAFIADSFVDFIALYGHFAGGNYLSDEDEEYFEHVQQQQQQQQYEEAGDSGQLIPASASSGRGGDQGDGGDVPADERTPLRRTASSLHATASNRKAFFLVIKAFIGTGVLVLPRAFYNGGLLTSCVLMVAVAWYAWHCILLLAEVYLEVGGSYSEIGLKTYGRLMQYSITTSIVLAQIGGCCAYTIFVAQNWRNVFNTLTNCQMNLATDFWVVIQLLVFIPLALIRQIRYFAPVALVANVLIIVSLSYLLGYDVWSISVNGSLPIQNYNPVRFPLLVGTAVYSFEGVTLVIPILDSLKEKRDFGKVLTLAITLCLGLFLCVGSLSYMTFGEKVEAVVLLNLPNESNWTILVQLLYSIAILFSMPLQLFPAVKIVEAMIFTRGSGREHKSIKWQKNIFRTLTVLLISSLAIFGADQLDNVVSLVGSFCLVPLSFIYPASMHLKAIAKSRWVRIKDICLVCIGLVALVYVTYVSIITWGASDPPIDICVKGP